MPSSGDDHEAPTQNDDYPEDQCSGSDEPGPRTEGSTGGSESTEIDVDRTPFGESGPEAERIREKGGTRKKGGVLRWFFRTDHPGVTFLREFVWSVLVVVLIGLLLFAISGVWPPMVAVKSGSMEPHMYRGDLVFVMDNGRFVPEEAVGETGVVPYKVGKETGYRTFGDYGDVIVYRKNGRTDATPIIHRARFWVEDGENWYDEANPAYLPGNSCEAIPNCPAPHAGFITKGDDNGQYDQVNGISDPVKPSWIKGTAEFRIPWLGHVRLKLSAIRP